MLVIIFGICLNFRNLSKIKHFPLENYSLIKINYNLKIKLTLSLKNSNLPTNRGTLILKKLVNR